MKFSAERYVPNLLPIIPKYRIVSARTGYEEHYPGQPLCWKAAAFAHEVNETFSAYESQRMRSDSNSSSHDCENDGLNTSCGSLVSTDDSSDGSNNSGAGTSPMYMEKRKRRGRREIISFGDSMEERTVVQIVAGQLSSVPKSVMFLTSPTPVELIGQLKMLTSSMSYVCDHRSSLDLEISSKQAMKCAEAHLQEIFPDRESKPKSSSFFQRIQNLI